MLVLNASEAMYSYWSQLLNYLKEYDAVMVAMVDEGMHSSATMATMEQLFDGVIELKIHEEGLSITPYLRIKKMLGVTPIYGYFRFSVSRNSMEVAPIVK